MLDEKDLQAIDQLIARRLGVVVESDITPKFNMLAEAVGDIDAKLKRKTVGNLSAELYP